MHGGLELARPRRRKWRIVLVVAAIAVLLAALPRLAAGGPAVLAGWDQWLANRLMAGYTDRLDELTQQNAALHARLAEAESALAENESLRSLLGSGRTAGSWQPARVVARWGDRLRLACTAREGAAVLDAQGRYAGRINTADRQDTCVMVVAGSEEAPCAGLCGEVAGLLTSDGGWVLTGLPADCGLAAGAVVTTPGGYWLGTLAEAPVPEPGGLTARAALTDTAALDSTVFFVKNE